MIWRKEEILSWFENEIIDFVRYFAFILFDYATLSSGMSTKKVFDLKVKKYKREMNVELYFADSTQL